MRTPVLAVVEIGGDPVVLLIVGVFVVTFTLICAVAYVLLGKARHDRERSTWTLQVGTRLPVSKDTFDRIARTAAAAVKPPEISPETRATLDSLDSARNVFVVIYRTVMIAVGLAGIVAGVMVLRAHTPANQYGLPGGILLLFALGALLNGLMPPRSIKPVEPLSPDLVRQMREKIHVNVTTERIEVPFDDKARSSDPR